MDRSSQEQSYITDIGREIGNRHAALRRRMAEEGIELYLILSSPRNPHGTHWASNYDLVGEGAMVVLPLLGDPALYITEAWDLGRAASLSPIKDIRHADDLARVAGKLLQQNRSAITGLESEAAAFVSSVSAWAGREVASDSTVLDRATVQKSAFEQEIIRKAASLADLAYERGYEILSEGIAEFEFLAEMEYAMRRAGAIDNFGFFSSGTHLHAIGVATAKPIVTGDYLIFEITPAVVSRNYSAQLCKTMTLGPASKALKEKHEILMEAFTRSVELIKPGVPISAVTKAMDDVITSHGYGEYCKPPYMRARGHGFGLGSVTLSQKNHQLMESGMALIVHPNQYFPDTGYLALGEMIIVTAQGAERLSRLRPVIYEKM